MASNEICESCFDKGKSVNAVKLCTDCDEKLCKECGDYHIGFKAFKSHHLIQLSSVPSNMSVFQNCCDVHENMALDFYCTNHNTTCCRMCIPEIHKSCTNVLPLDVASKNVHKSSLLTETLSELDNITKTLQSLSEEREENIETLQNSVSLIKEKIAVYKKRLIKQIDDLERKLLEQVRTTQKHLKIAVEKTRNEISEKISKTKQAQEELEFLENHGTCNQLFLALHKYDKKLQSLGTEITEIISACEVVDINFDLTSVDISSLGNISKTTKLCDVQFMSSKLKQAQKRSSIPARHISKFQRDDDVQLKQTIRYVLTGMAVTADEKLLLCNYYDKNVYKYTNCKFYESELKFSSKPCGIAVIPGTNNAVVTLPKERSIEIINIVSMTTEDKIVVRLEPQGVTASIQNIIIGGSKEINVLSIKGVFQKRIIIPSIFDRVHSISLNNRKTEILLTSSGKLCSIDFKGNMRYQYSIDGETGVAVDGDGDVYVGVRSRAEIHRLSPEGKLREIVLTSKNGLDRPGALQFNTNISKLFVVNNFATVATFACSS